ncbi:hypothetical protein [Romboutsia sp.]|uniref:hypothetical protein n=1 Tax=Romboutsia sp. TaxID=1965302 RepID=UPI002BDCDB81|nr:hypothetical protein [Romboutsia sp.]HSQ89808.1 hypothetical protein [Romboutsia sp.]
MHSKILDYVNKCINDKKDFTIRIDCNGKLYKPASGFVISITPLINIGMDTFEIIKYITSAKNIDIDGKSHKLYLGGWFENNKDKLTTDISVVTESIDEAIQIGKHCNQNAIYNISKQEVIYL